MAEIIWGIDIGNSTSNYTPVKRFCRQTGKMCELTGDFGYCQVTACVKQNYNTRTVTENETDIQR